MRQGSCKTPRKWKNGVLKDKLYLRAPCRWYNRLRYALLLFLTLTAGCALLHRSYSVGFDATWYPQNFGVEINQINAFTRALLQEIGNSEKTSFNLSEIGTLSLMNQLKEQTVDGILSSLSPNLENCALYDFSDPFLRIGPVLVLPVSDTATQLSDLKDKIIGIYRFDQTILLAQTNPTLLIHTYDNMVVALEDLSKGAIDAVLINTLEAHRLIPTHFAGRLWIATPPLTEDALRLVALKGEHTGLITLFNRGLKKAQRSGDYTALRTRFGVY